MNTSHKTKTQAKTLTPITVTFLKNTKDLELANDMFNRDALTGQLR